MIKLSNPQGRVRETTAPFEYTDDKGKVQTADIRVIYRSPTITDIRVQKLEREARENAGESLYISDSLASVIDALPDLTDDNEKEIAITVENLDQLTITNLTAIQKAINEDIEGKSQSSKSHSG